ncbi:hypothetical protein FSP39_021955 [Pinctada imbricata]|uniref:Apple domain-containing protein n=1 Tax=Pinctada imbricata TaxID=66713 RepID=A0AA88XXY1_PINIB|nr:hypothetical protein FSP39_021955 [Pinctada imbricata]
MLFGRPSSMSTYGNSFVNSEYTSTYVPSRCCEVVRFANMKHGIGTKSSTRKIPNVSEKLGLILNASRPRTSRTVVKNASVNSLTTINGSPYIVISNGLVKKLGQNLDSCAKACLEETAIRCQFFKFVNNTGTCFLSDADNADIQKRIADDIADTNKGKHKDFTSASGNKFEDVHENHHTLSDVVDPELQDTHRSHHQNKPSRLIYSEEPYKLHQRHRAGNGGKSRRNHKQSDKGRQTKIHRQIKKKIRKMNSKLNRVEKHLKRLMKIKGDTEDLKDAIKEKTRSTKDLLKNDRKENKIMKKIKRKLNSLGKKSEDITEELVSLKQTQDTLSKHLMKVEKSGVHLGQTVNTMKASNGRLEKSIKSLKKDDSEMNNRTSTVQSKVESVKAQLDSLTNLTSALNLSEANLSKNQWRAVSAIGKYAKMTKDIDQKYVGLRLKMKHVTRELGNSESGRKTLKDNVKEVKKKLKTIQRTVSRSKDPMNSNKRHRQRELNWLKNELSNLRSRSKNIKSGVRRSKNEMSDIRRQMNKVKLFKEDMEDKFESLQQTSKQLNMMVKTVQKDMSSPKYRVKMAKLESKMKNALETLKYRERSIREKLKGFSERMDKLRKQIRWRSNIKGIWRYIRDIKIKKKALLASLENTKSISKVEILRLRKSQHDLEQRLRKLKQKTRKVTKDMMSKSELHKRINNAVRKLDRFWWRKKMAMNTKMMKEYRKNEREKKRLMRELKEIKTVYHKVLKSFRKPPEEQLLKVGNDSSAPQAPHM